jgi:Tfp pilus assembly protein PilO
MTPVKRIFQEKRRLIVPLLVAIAANVALYAVAVYPLQRRVATADERAQAAAAARRAAEQNLRAAQATVTGKDRADDELRRFYKSVLPADQTGARRITYLRLQRMARDTGLSAERGRTEVEPLEDSRLWRLKTEMVLVGEYHQIRRFIHRIETAPEFTVIEDVSLARGGEESSELMLTLAVATYYWTPIDGD